MNSQFLSMIAKSGLKGASMDFVREKDMGFGCMRMPLLDPED